MSLSDHVQKITGHRPSKIVYGPRGPGVRFDSGLYVYYELDGGNRITPYGGGTLDLSSEKPRPSAESLAELFCHYYRLRPQNEREALGLDFAHYKRRRSILNKVRKDRLRGRLVTDKEWPAWTEIERMATEASGG